MIAVLFCHQLLISDCVQRIAKMSHTVISISPIFNGEKINWPTHEQRTITVAIACCNEDSNGDGLVGFLVPAAEYGRDSFQPTPPVPFRELANPGTQPAVPLAYENLERYEINKEICSDNSNNYKAQQRDLKACHVILQASLSDTVKGNIGDTEIFTRLCVQYGSLLTKDYSEFRLRIDAPVAAGTKIDDHVAIDTKIHQVRAALKQSLPMETQVHIIHTSISKVLALRKSTINGRRPPQLSPTKHSLLCLLLLLQPTTLTRFKSHHQLHWILSCHSH